jgi:hypothetical protein
VLYFRADTASAVAQAQCGGGVRLSIELVGHKPLELEVEGEAEPQNPIEVEISELIASLCSLLLPPNPLGRGPRRRHGQRRAPNLARPSPPPPLLLPTRAG